MHGERLLRRLPARRARTEAEAGRLRIAAHEFLEDSDVEVVDAAGEALHRIDDVGALPVVECAPHQGLVEGRIGMAEAGDAGSVTEGLRNAGAQHQAGVLELAR